MPVVGRLALVLATALVGALAATLAFALAHRPEEALGGAGSAAHSLQLLTGVGLWLAGMQLALRRSLHISGWLLAATGPALLVEALPSPGSLGAMIFTAGLAGGLAAPAIAGAAALAYPTPARTLPDAALGGAAVLSALLVAGVLPALLFDPRAAGCFGCPRNLLLIHGDADLADGLLRAGLVVSAVLCAAVAALAAWRLVRRPAPVRRFAAAVAVPLVVATAIGAAMFAHDVAAVEPVRDEFNRILWLGFCGSLTLAVVAVAAEAGRARLLHGRIAGMVLDTLPSPLALRTALATELGDPDLGLAFSMPDGRTIDASGDPLPPAAAGSGVTLVRRRGEIVAEVRHEPALAHGDMVRSAAQAAAPALEHAALQARLRAELRALDASRARVIETADRERSRLERDLHDGAQQRLIALTVALHGDPAQGELLAALEELRDIAHGIHPVALSDAGLEAAIRYVADASRVPLRLIALPEGRLPAPVESAAHRLVADAVDYAARTGVSAAVEISIARDGALLHIQIRLPGVDAERAVANLEHCADRLTALGGRLDFAADDTIHGLLPCES